MHRPFRVLGKPFRSLRHFLSAFVLAVVLPSLAFSLAIGWFWGRKILDEREQDASRLAASAANSMATYLSTLEASLEMLSQLPSGKDDVATLYSVAQKFAKRTGKHVVLTHPDGHHIFTTRLPLGESLPLRTDGMDSARRTLETGKPSVTNLFMGKVAKKFIVGLDTRLDTPEGPRLLSISTDATSVAEALHRIQVPKGWLLGLIDGQGKFIVTGRGQEWLGKPAAPEVWQAAQGADAGVLHNTSVEGFPILTVFHRVPDTDWRVLIGVPEAVLYADLYWQIGLLAGSIAFVIGLTGLVAVVLIRQLNAAARDLTAVARNPLAHQGKNSIAEFEDVAQVIKSTEAKRQILAEELEAVQASHRQSLEAQVAERTSALQKANRDLQAFTYAASHDLRGPLGRINTFSELLEKNYRDRLEGEGLNFLSFIRSNATRLTALVEDLLAHSQIEQHTMDHKPLDIRTIVQAILDEKRSEIANLQAEVHIDLPSARISADPLGLWQVLNNVIGNAFKYSAKANPPVITVGAEVREQTYRLWVRDNGIGFDMAYHDTVFEIFRRLHTYQEIPGSGVGLALVKKAMERMGGKVWAESEPGKGATFYLELQVATEEERT